MQPRRLTAVELELEQIAGRKLGITNLETRNSDRLDFHEVGVASIKAALLEAYELGRSSVYTKPTITRCPDCNAPTHASEGDDHGRCAGCSSRTVYRPDGTPVKVSVPE